MQVSAVSQPGTDSDQARTSRLFSSTVAGAAVRSSGGESKGEVAGEAESKRGQQQPSTSVDHGSRDLGSTCVPGPWYECD